MAGRQLTAQADVAVVGAGPAGSAAALTLRRHLPNLQVALLDRRPVHRAGGTQVPGEALSPGVLPLLDYLGLRQAFEQAGHLRAGGTASAWGSDQALQRHYLFSGRGEGWHVDRARFDGWLRQQAETAGAVCMPLRVTDLARKDERWLLQLEGPGPATLQADCVIDATGRAAGIARRCGAAIQRHDNLTALAGWYEHDSVERSSTGALVEATPDGWWYSATLPDRRGVAMFMTSADRLKGSAAARQARWQAALISAPLTAQRMATWRARGPTLVRAANSQCASQVAGPGWVAAGDAAAAFDPLASLGIGFALRSGMEAARAAAGALDGDTAPAQAYAESLRRIYADYRQRLRHVYALERRWPDAPFWAGARG